MEIKLYGTANCAACNMTKRWLVDNEIPFEEIDVTHNEEVREYLRSQGKQRLPQIETTKESWDGFRPDKLRKLVS